MSSKTSTTLDSPQLGLKTSRSRTSDTLQKSANKGFSIK